MNSEKNVVTFAVLQKGEKFEYSKETWIKKNFMTAVTEDGTKLYNFDHRAKVKRITIERPFKG